MEPSTKRQKLNNDASHNGAGGSGWGRGQHHHDHVRASNHFDGQGIQNHHGNFSVAGDLQLIHVDRSPGPQRYQAEDDRRALLDSLRFDQLSIKKPHADTCQWFLKTSQYMQWIERDEVRNDHNFLWIKGKPGAGKSTLMKFLYRQLEMRIRREKVDQILVSFFFNARGSDLEKSIAGLYQSLLLQLLEARPDLQHVLDTIRVGHQWTIESLQSLLEESILELGDTTMICLIDALDECEEKQVREMVSFLSELAASKKDLHVCFASRHYPHITVENAVDIVLEHQDEHSQDIAKYISSALRIGRGRVAEQIRLDIQEKASGVFMWVFLVVDILTKEYDSGNKHLLRERIRQIPKDLHDLFHSILTRENSHIGGLLLCLQWVMFAKQPLTPKQLYFAILSGLQLDHLEQCHSDDISDDDITKFILNNSRGLAESTKSKAPTVQFIHESVRDFLLKDGGFIKIWPNLGPDFRGHSHDILKRCCLNYMRAELVSRVDITDPLPVASSDEAIKVRRNVGDKLPFLEYATANILFHANEAETGSCDQEKFLHEFPVSLWIHYRNVFQKHQMRRYGPNASIMYLLAESNLASLIRAHYVGQSCFVEEEQRYGMPILAALAMNNQEAVQALLEGQAQSHPPDSPLHGLCRLYAQDETEHGALGVGFTFSQEKGVLSHLAERGLGLILTFAILSENLDLDAPDRRDRTPIFYAAKEHHWDIVQQLHLMGADIECYPRGSSPDSSPLHLAFKAGHFDQARMLIRFGANVLAPAEFIPAPLVSAFEFVATLREAKLDNSLVDAEAHIMEILVELNYKKGPIDGMGLTPLHWASRVGSDKLVELLITNGANMEARDYDGMTPMLWASREGHITVVDMLIKNGSDVRASDRKGLNALHWAVILGRQATTVELLIDAGSDIEAEDRRGMTPLLLAVRNSRLPLVQLLIRKGSNVSATDKYGCDILYRAKEVGIATEVTSCLTAIRNRPD